jgi:two-component system cell cycle sensor histidine kinase PleC
MFLLPRRRRDTTRPIQKNQGHELWDRAPDDTIETVRVAADEHGIIMYASNGFSALAGLEETPPNNRPLQDVMQFSGLDSASYETLEAGLHQVVISGKRENFYFDWVTGRDRKRYLVGSQILSNAPAASHSYTPAPVKIVESASGQLTANDLAQFSHLNQDVMVVVDDLGTIMRTNQQAAEILGYKPEELCGMDFIEIFEESERPYIRNTIQTLNLDEERSGEHCIEFEAKIQTKSGGLRWMSWRQCQSGDHMFCLGHDVHDLKIQKESLSRHEQQLIQAESIGRMGHWRWVIGEHDFTWSDEIYRIFGVTRDQFKPTLDSMNRMVHKRDIDRVNQAFQRAIIEQNDYDMEFRVIQPGGEIRFIRCEGRCELDEQDDVIALYGIMQDMTETALHARDLKEAKEAVERAYNAKSQFLANMSHELRTPLNAIIGFSEMIERQLLGPIGTEKYLEYISGIRQSGEHLLDIISDILDMSKIEAGKYELALEEVNLQKIIKTALHMIENRAMDDDIKLSYDGSIDDEQKIVADRRALLQILLNLLSNAVKFTNRGGKVSVECHAREDYVVLKVIDNGIGIPANKLSSITNPFEQVSSHYTREHDGSGLGLAITKELVELHGGALFIDSAVNVGTTVTVRLPFEAKQA